MAKKWSGSDWNEEEEPVSKKTAKKRLTRAAKQGVEAVEGDSKMKFVPSVLKGERVKKATYLSSGTIKALGKPTRAALMKLTKPELVKLVIGSKKKK